MAANGGAIATLRLVGARDGFIRGAVTRPITLGALCGALAGTVAGLGLVALLPRQAFSTPLTKTSKVARRPLFLTSLRSRARTRTRTTTVMMRR